MESVFKGIVVRAYPSGDSDLVLKVVSEHSGKISVIVKAARKSRKKFGSQPDIFDTGTFEARPGRGGLMALQSFIPLTSHRKLRETLDRVSAASLLCELADGLFPEEGHESADLYQDLSAAFSALEKAVDLREMLRETFYATAKLLRHSGYLDESSAGEATSGNLQRLLLNAEQTIGRKLRSKEEISALVLRLKKSAAELPPLPQE